MTCTLALILGVAVGHTGELAVPFEHYELDNGLDVIIAVDSSTPIVSVNTWYHVGSKDETEGLSGFAHLFEHLMFQGSASQPEDFFTPIDEVGGDVNGTTNADRTNYYQTVPSQHLPMALFVESDRMGWLLIDNDRLDNQKEVVRNERRQRYENRPYGKWHLDLYASLYPQGHPYHHATIGSHEDLENATLDDVQAFFDRWYVPNNAALVITGDLDIDATKATVLEYFGDIPSGAPITRTPPPAHALSNSITLRQRDRVPEQRLWLAWHSPAHYAEGDAELDLLAMALATGPSSRLYQRLVQTGIAKTVGAGQYSRRLTSTFIISATPAPGHTTDEVVAIIDEVLAEITAGSPPTDEELAAARAGIETGFYSRLRTVQSKANALNQALYQTGDPSSLMRYNERFTSLTADRVAEVGAEVFAGHRVALHIHPDTEDTPDEARSFWKRLFKPRDASEDAP
jgi:predicted Zn-dependent peptidase